MVGPRPERIHQRQSVAGGEALPVVAGLLDLVDDGHGGVLHRDVAFSVLVGEEVVQGGAVAAGTVAGLDLRGRADVGPVDVAVTDEK